MAKMRVYELANSLGLEVETAMELLRQVGAAPRNHMSVVERVPARRVRQLLKQNKNAALPPTQIQQQTEQQPVAPPPIPVVERTEAVPPPDQPQASPSSPSVQPTAAQASAPAGAGAEGVQTRAQQTAKAPEPSQETSAKTVGKATQTEPERTPEPVKGKAKVEAAPVAKGASQEAAAKTDTKPAEVKGERPGGARPAAAQGERTQAKRSQERAEVAQGSEVKARQQPTTRQAKAEGPVERTAAQRATSTRRDQEAEASKSPERQQATRAKARPKVESPSAQSQPARRGRKGGTLEREQAVRASVQTPTGGSRRSKRNRASKAERGQATPAKPTGPIVIPESLTVSELAETLQVPATAIIMKLMEAGVMAGINQSIEFEVASRVAEKLGFEVTRTEKKSVARGDFDDPEESLVPRPPVVTIMGHVDHGKTTLLDTIRQSKVAEHEAGGITQHIGAYQIEVNGQKITFLDTPGHEAFTSMRSRGAQVTDIAVLVVAADDGVMPQTVEAISHARAADVPIIVAVNKMDRQGANPDRVKQQLVDHGLVPEEWGGDTICVEVSALKREGIDDLLEMILLVAEIRELKANPDRRAVGVVIDAELDKTRGPVATVLVQSGTLRQGDSLVAGAVYGRVRAMYDEYGGNVEEAGPSRPVAILGLSDVPQAGDLVQAVEDDRVARQIATERAQEDRETEMQRGAGRIRLSEIYSKSQSGDVKDLNLLIKADVQGSVEALRQSVEKIKSEEVRINVIHAAVGGINESDVALAAASDAIIIGFNVRPETTARRAAEREDVEIRLYRVIYEAIEEIEAAMEGLLEPTYEEVVLGRAEIRQLFRVPNIGTVAGCYVTEGTIHRQAEARLIRDNIVIHEGKLGSLKRFKDDVREVSEGYECGLSFERYQDLKEGDVVESFRMEEVKK